MGTQIIIITASFSVAVSESYKNKAGEKVEECEWFNVAMFRGLAGVAENYLKKGSKVYIEGKLKSREYQDKEGQTRRATELIASKMTMLSTLAEANGGNPNPSPNQAEETDSDLPF
jgi:single-strand DNA-binding protein